MLEKEIFQVSCSVHLAVRFHARLRHQLLSLTVRPSYVEPGRTQHPRLNNTVDKNVLHNVQLLVLVQVWYLLNIPDSTCTEYSIFAHYSFNFSPPTPIFLFSLVSKETHQSHYCLLVSKETNQTAISFYIQPHNESIFLFSYDYGRPDLCKSFR